MGIGSVWPWLVVLVIVMLLFGRGRVSGLMGDVASGVKSFRRGLADDEDKPAEQPLIENSSEEPVRTAQDEKTSTG